MSLSQFLKDNKDTIIKNTESLTIALAALRPNSEQLQNGLPIFFDQLVHVLNKDQAKVETNDELKILGSAGTHGKELLRLGYTLSHVVHSYGSMCQAITGLASDLKAPISALEFHNLNRCLDIAIAGAVTEFESIHNLETKNREVMHLGIIAHELRNALNRARISFEMLTKGIVGLGGSTSKVLGRSLDDLDILINRSLSEVRLRAESELNEEYFLIIEIISQLIVTAEIEAGQRQQTLSIVVDPNIGVFTDRHLILSAVGNLIQNSLKFSEKNKNISIVGKLMGANVIIEVFDQCGGISEEKLKNIFKPFAQENKDRSGLGLGLIIAKQAIEKCGGTLVARNINDGCVFTVSLPVYLPAIKSQKDPVV
jgi:hypothetical protein